MYCMYVQLIFVHSFLNTDSVLVNEDINGLFSESSSDELKDSIPSSSYFLCDIYSDVTIKIGESTFPAHKIILSGTSLT